MDFKRRILINDHSGHPFSMQLSRALARRGHEILYSYSSSFQGPKGTLNRRADDPKNFQIKGIELSKSFQKYNYIKRKFQEREFGRILSFDIKNFKPDVMISGNTPLDAQSVILKTVLSKNIRFIFWVQDIYSIAMREILTKRKIFLGAMISKYYKRMEQKQLQKSDAVVLITDDFIPLIRSWNIENSKCHVIPNWAPINELRITPKENDWSIKKRLNDKFCIMYSGTLGMKHNPEILLKISQFYKKNDDVRVVVISEGIGAEWLKKKKSQFNLKNLVVMNFQTFEDLPNVLSTADIFIAILEPDAGIFSVPSKILTYLCFKRPLLLSVPAENLAARIVSQNNAGQVINSNNVDMIIEKLDMLVKDSSLRKKMGINALKYAENNFNINVIADSFEKIINNIHQGDEIH
jgi:colanic acid biosynthesis glycosyl transferase WcaI